MGHPHGQENMNRHPLALLAYKIFDEGSRMIDVVIPYTSGDIINLLHSRSQVLSEEFSENGTHIRALCPVAIADHIGSKLLPDGSVY